ncbi:pentatricopeptide repeat-containing protein [Dorcoceras hygrometricum]|uniref:Pentatricopeptide repeat-containing protein n=1 Tax=Dorcoceras hygrometricum TaxID=472368 RepID=A0A2Z7BT89_9LAMI|nr:pentatricopeptide repeat-containing protein [Dorcoceras hygrometricum]
MLLQPTTPKPTVHFHNRGQDYVSISSKSSYSISFSSWPVKYTGGRDKNLVFFSCSSASRVQSYGRIGSERRPRLKWNDVYTKISMMEDQNMSSALVLNQAVGEGRSLPKWELHRVVKELRKFRRYKSALEVLEWMNDRAEYRIGSSETAIQLDLIAKVYGASSAEQYFLNLPDSLKDKRIYGALLNVYAQARMREKAESLMNKMRNRGYASYTLPFNVMMTLYMNLGDHEKVESLVLEMKDSHIELDSYTYNIWLSSRGSQGSASKMERVFEQMRLDTTTSPNWTTYSTMATVYIKLEQFEKAKNCLRMIETRITGRNRIPYHYLISLYANAGSNEDVYRVWNIYKANFLKILNLGYQTMISALVRLDDIDGAEKIYDEWLSVKSLYDPRVGNLLLGSYVRNGLSEKAEIFFDQMIHSGGKPNPMTWEILAEDHINNGRASEALSCLKNATSALGSKSWKPKPTIISSIINISKQEADTATQDALLDILKRAGCLDDENYMSNIPISIDGPFKNTNLAQGTLLPR